MSKLQKQYEELKEKDPDKIYLFKVGIFYNILNEDARKVSNEIGLKLTDLSPEIIKCGFPIAKLEKYTQLLDSKGLKYAIVPNQTSSNQTTSYDNIIKKIINLDMNNTTCKEAFDILYNIQQNFFVNTFFEFFSSFFDNFYKKLDFYLIFLYNVGVIKFLRRFYMDNIQESFSTRLDKAMKLRNIKSVELHKKTGISESLISKYLSGNALARQKKIFLISKVLDVNPAWLMGYDVPMADLKAVKIPILNNVSLSMDLFSKENIKDYTTFRIKTYWDSNVENYFAIAAPDDDMLPLLGKGDLAIVHIQNEIENGNTALVFLKDDNKYTIKKVIETKTGIELHSMNPTVKEIQTTYENVVIIGRVIKADVESAFE